MVGGALGVSEEDHLHDATSLLSLIMAEEEGALQGVPKVLMYRELVWEELHFIYLRLEEERMKTLNYSL